MTPDVNDLPMLKNGYVTFASLNNFSKVTQAARALWVRILIALPDSRLLIHTVNGPHRERLLDAFEAQGIERGRIEFFELLPIEAYFQLLQRVDISLDPFPYPGGTTTCDALWMGVPTVSLVGQLAFTRSGLSILSNVGLPELATNSEQEYFEKVLALANDPQQLASLRRSLRDRMMASPLMDAPKFASALQSMFREAWLKWIASQESAQDVRVSE